MLVAACLVARAASGEQPYRWPELHGGDAASHLDASSLPLTWSPEGIAWKTELEGAGQSSPVIWDDLQARLDAGDAAFARDPRHGYLPSLLSALGIPPSSQALVFSKTSRQRPMIGPQTPRSIYFSDDVYVATVVGGYIEVAVADPRLGMVFYTLDADAHPQPTFVRETDACLTCHAQFRTRNVPGLRLDSVFVDAGGEPIDAGGVERMNHETPFEQRWGGWGGTAPCGTAATRPTRAPAVAPRPSVWPWRKGSRTSANASISRPTWCRPAISSP